MAEEHSKFLSENNCKWFLPGRKVIICGKITRHWGIGFDTTFPWEKTEYYLEFNGIRATVTSDVWYRVKEGNVAKISGYYSEGLTNCTLLSIEN
ncbi:MAG: hypothetical protein HQM10_22185 [Candidatus Riflebacteria bacterium]|nr:hypothetical protein [Candidatus Riflebacteria bacterium]